MNAKEQQETGSVKLDTFRFWLVRGAILLTIGVIALGAYTRLSDAGLGCPDWPGCYGQLTVPVSKQELQKANELYPNQGVETSKAWAEMIHRYFAGSLGLVVFAITVLFLKKSTSKEQDDAAQAVGKLLPVALTILVIAQALLGMWTVTLKLMPVIVLAHLLGGFTLLSLLVLLHTQLCSIPKHSQQPCLQIQLQHQSQQPNTGSTFFIKFLSLFALIVIVLQISLGGWTSSNYAALMCTSLPVCQGEWINHLDFKTAFSLYQPGFDNYEFGVLDFAGRTTIHVSHRIGAIITSLVVMLFCWQLAKSTTKFHKQAAKQLFALLVIQVGLGISNVVFTLPLTIAVLHNVCGALLLANTVRISYSLCSNKPFAYKRRTSQLAPSSIKPSLQNTFFAPKETGDSHE
ncbi:COX15/CtaA family protein [Vibrio algarum]|uniref:COX15/CtaA family protein n=1 Tax=Vibrio algarum TaxID=3020714 RepID=A0ABT4YXA1_9VIBR|nr:COX15/CtaA family protein [Vibrio sp. KJ40-1]MDB1126221.1 COX15/CtaA family protein [Vibrio sp. KJ40-1]